MPRRLLGAALVEAFAHIARETQPPEPEPAPAPPERRAEIAEAIGAAFDLPPDILRKDPR